MSTLSNLPAFIISMPLGSVGAGTVNRVESATDSNAVNDGMRIFLTNNYLKSQYV